MSNAAHYELEESLKKHVDLMSLDALRALVKRLIHDGSVNTVNEIASILKIK